MKYRIGWTVEYLYFAVVDAGSQADAFAMVEALHEERIRLIDEDENIDLELPVEFQGPRGPPVKVRVGYDVTEDYPDTAFAEPLGGDERKIGKLTVIQGGSK